MFTVKTIFIRLPKKYGDNYVLYTDEEVSNYINTKLSENNIDPYTLIDIKFSCGNNSIDILIIYKIMLEEAEEITYG